MISAVCVTTGDLDDKGNTGKEGRQSAHTVQSGGLRA